MGSFRLTAWQGPVVKSQTVAASTQVDFQEATTGIHAQASGTITVRLMNDTTDVSLAVVQGATYPYRVASVPATNATAFVGLFYRDF